MIYLILFGLDLYSNLETLLFILTLSLFFILAGAFVASCFLYEAKQDEDCKYL